MERTAVPTVQMPRFMPGDLVERARTARAAASVGYTPTTERENLRLSDSTKMLLALGMSGKHLYQGTVPPAIVARRRAKNRAARRARRVHRR